MVGDRGGAGGVWVVENALENPGWFPVQFLDPAQNLRAVPALPRC